MVVEEAVGTLILARVLVVVVVGTHVVIHPVDLVQVVLLNQDSLVILELMVMVVMGVMLFLTMVLAAAVPVVMLETLILVPLVQVEMHMDLLHPNMVLV